MGVPALLLPLLLSMGVFAACCVVASQSSNGTDCSAFNYYESTCGTVAGCQYCCSSGLCLSSIQTAQCPAQDLSGPGSRSCVYRCQASSNCTACNALSWCAYCPKPAQCYEQTSSQCETTFLSACPITGSPAGTSTTTTTIISLSVVGGCIVTLAISVFLCRRFRAGWRSPARNADTRGPAAAVATAAMTTGSATVNAAPSETQPLLAGETRSAANTDIPAATHAVVDVPRPGEERPALRNHSDDDESCQLCLERRADTVFLPCYHAYCCESCSERLKPNKRHQTTCPFCRTPVSAMVNIRRLDPAVVKSVTPARS